MSDNAATERGTVASTRAPQHLQATRDSFTSLGELCLTIRRHLRLFLWVLGSALALCTFYCVIAPRSYEAAARVEMKNSPESALTLDRTEIPRAGLFAVGQIQLETLANVLRSDQLAWRTIGELNLYRNPGFVPRFDREFPEFNVAQPTPEAREYLLEKFHRALTVQSVPHTLVLQIRFRSRDPRLSAEVVNALIDFYQERDTNLHVKATKDATAWLGSQLNELKMRVDQNDRQLVEFQRQHELLDTPETAGAKVSGETGHSGILTQVDTLNRELAEAETDRILLEAEYRAAQAADPEMVFASDAKLETIASSGLALLQQLRARRSELAQEQAQLRTEHGPNFPRVVEIRSQLQDIDRQINEEDARLVERIRSAWHTAADREQLVKKNLDAATSSGLKMNEAALQYAMMRQEADASHEVYVRVMQQAEQAGLAAGTHSSDISVIDDASEPAKPVSPNIPVYLGIAAFIGFWSALVVVLARDGMLRKQARAVVLIAVATMTLHSGWGQAPTPNTSGLPSGVAHIPQSSETKVAPDPKEAPPAWSAPKATTWNGVPPGSGSPITIPMAGPIGPGDMLEVTEAHTQEFRSTVRVSEAGTVTLMLAGEVHVGGTDERGAARAIESALLDRGMLLHPQVNVLVMAYAGQDVSVLGEVGHPGVYSLTAHHRLLDLISAASGLTPVAGRLVMITHRNDSDPAQVVVLDTSDAGSVRDHNPELLPGDTVQVSRAGLVYVVGDVVRPGGFPVDRSQASTVMQAMSLAWGPGQNAALTKAVLIREQAGGRIVTRINLKRMLRGQDPDIPIRDHDILFVPNSTAKDLWNRTMESAIQSAAGVSIYAGLVYSQRF